MTIGIFGITGLLASVAGLAQGADLLSARNIEIQRLSTSISQNKLSEVRDWFAAVETDTRLSDIEREALLYDGVIALAALSGGDPGLAATVDAMTRMEPVSMTSISEGRHTLQVPTYDVASAARLTQSRWRQNAARDRVAARLSLGHSPIPAWTGDPEVDQDLARGVELAVQSLPVSRLYVLQPALLEAYASQPLLAASVLNLALKTGDSASLILIAQTAAPIDALKLLRLPADALPGNDLLQVIDAMRQRDALASAAILKLGTLLDQEPAAADTLFGLLGDPDQGGSAATALARHGGGIDLARLSGVVTDDPGGVAANRALMALRLSEDPAARAQLAGLADDPRLDDEKKAEVSQWLHD